MRNFNLGILGHVDSGKTSIGSVSCNTLQPSNPLAKVLSEIKSTAAFDQDPQSLERGITIDLGFSAFNVAAVDCPGHASLIRTILCGVHIIDAVLLVVDATKGIQAQTLDCIILAEIFNLDVLVVLNKCDVAVDADRVESRLRAVLGKLDLRIHGFARFSCAMASPGYRAGLLCAIAGLASVAKARARSSESLLLHIDHCFALKGKGTILTGTILAGSLKLHDCVQILAGKAEIVRRVKSLQSFRTAVSEAQAGDRIAMRVHDLDPTGIERCLGVAPNSIQRERAIFTRVKKVKHYRGRCNHSQKLHGTTAALGCVAGICAVTIFHETILAQIHLFKPSDHPTEYEIADGLGEDELLAVVLFPKPVPNIRGAVIVASRLDLDLALKECRFVFHGQVVDKPPSFSVIRKGSRILEVERIHDSATIIGRPYLGHAKHIGSPVELVSKEDGVWVANGRIASSFGTAGKFIVNLEGPVQDHLKASKLSIRLNFKRPVSLGGGIDGPPGFQHNKGASLC